MLVERVFALTLLAFGLVGVGASQLALQRAPAWPPDASLDRLGQAAREGAPPALFMSGVLLGLFLSGVYLLLRRGPAAVRALREATGRPPPAPGLGLALFLLGIGALAILQALAGAALPRPQVLASEATAPGTRALPLSGELPVGGPRPEEQAEKQAGGRPAGREPAWLPLPESAAPRAVVRWADLSAWVEVRPGPQPVRLEGRALEPGLHPLELGRALEVGPWSLVVQGPRPAASLRWRTLAYAAAAGLILALWRVGAPPHPAGVAPLGVRAELSRGARAWVGCLPVYALVLIGTTLLLNLLGLRAAGHPLVRAVEQEGLSLLLPAFVQAVLLAPVAEEILFRGLLLPGLQRSLGRRGGLFVCAFVFAAVHGGLAAVCPMLVLGLLFAALRETSPTGSLLAPIAAHALHNGTTLLLVGGILLLG